MQQEDLGWGGGFLGPEPVCPHSSKLFSRSQVVIRRRPLFYAVSLLLPSIFLMVVDIVGFYLPPDSGERVSFKITLLLGYSVFLIIVSDTLPATAIGTPLIGKSGSRGGAPWGRGTGASPSPTSPVCLPPGPVPGRIGVYFVVCMALLVISLAETILIVRLVHKQDLQQPVPAWLRHLVLERVALLLCLGEQSTPRRPPATSQAAKTDGCSGETGSGEPHVEGSFWPGGRDLGVREALEGSPGQGAGAGPANWVPSCTKNSWQTSAQGVNQTPSSLCIHSSAWVEGKRV